jgi:NAD(P)-dependent dehydrogenase (short-subunit alcohol dehydrogenase family)
MSEPDASTTRLEGSEHPLQDLSSYQALSNARIHGKVAIVTGGAQGIGFAIAAGLAAAGAQVVIADLANSETAATRLNDLGDYGVEGTFVDVAEQRDTEDMARHVLERHGRIDVLVNNAALFSTLSPLKFTDIEVADWRRVMDVNVMGLWLCCRAVAGTMAAQGEGRIINIASAAQFKGAPFLLHYVSSKGAVVALTKALAREVGVDGILVNAVAPGFTLSDGVLANDDHIVPMTGVAAHTRALARHEHPEDVVGAVVFLAGPGSSFITGQTIVVDGGSFLH